MRTYSETKEKTQMLEQLVYVTPTTAKYNNDHPNWELQLQSIFQSHFEYVTLFVIRYKAHFSLAEYVSVSFTTLEIRFPLRHLYLHSDGHLAKWKLNYDTWLIEKDGLTQFNSLLCL